VSIVPEVRLRRVGWAGVFFILFCAGSLRAAELLFPEPRHFTRRIEDPISGTTSVREEYCAGNQVVTIDGDAVAIADYAKQQLIEIDRAAGTYSVTRFEAIARANPQPRRKVSSAAIKADDVKVDIRVDPSVALSRNAVEVLIGAAYPNPRRPEHDAILGRTRGLSADSATYALPIEQTIEHEGLTLRNAIVAINSDRVPPAALLIPPGAKLVESRLTRLARELRELDRLPE
jgi:hypothetical protein